MKENLKYDPEDLESLLLHKKFNELYPEEKEFVLRHMDGPGEYESMRKTLLDVIDSSRNEPWLEPDASIKANLMKHYASEEKRGYTIWLNTLFAQTAEWFKPQPALRYAIAGLALTGVIVSIWLVSRPEQDELLAENIVPPTSQQESVAPTEVQTLQEIDQNASPQQAEAVADIIAEAPIPPAPESMDVDFVFVTDDVSERRDVDVPAPAAASSGVKTVDSDMVESMADEVQKAEAESNVALDNVSADEIVIESEKSKTQNLSEIESVEIASKSRRSRNLASKTKSDSSKNAGAPIAEWDELFSLLYTAP